MPSPPSYRFIAGRLWECLVCFRRTSRVLLDISTDHIPTIKRLKLGCRLPVEEMDGIDSRFVALGCTDVSVGPTIANESRQKQSFLRPLDA